MRNRSVSRYRVGDIVENDMKTCRCLILELTSEPNIGETAKVYVLKSAHDIGDENTVQEWYIDDLKVLISL